PGGAPVEGASYQSTTDDSITRGYYASSQAGQSYIRINGQWVDLSSPDVRNMIDIISDGESQAGFGYLGLIGHHSAVPNNACIKVLFI
ncbi:MAG: hypothetical protein IKX80_02325, partial [Lachnospiraceae bacterium]|nr:hypothetical protein [Lachnospiraceae bacterium]